MAERVGVVKSGEGNALGDHIATFKYLKGAYKEDGERFFTKACSDRTTGFELKESRYR